MSTHLIVKCQFEGWHSWPEAPNDCAYLRNIHRHMFHVELTTKAVSNLNREIEFIGLKHKVQEWCVARFGGLGYGKFSSNLSCEHMAQLILREFDASQVEVFEDGENGAVAFVEDYK
jgi:hypothetical protein